MKLMVISILLILFIQSAFALDFTLTSPESVDLNQTFQVSISANTPDVYDVKIFVYKDSKEFSEIFNGTLWVSPHYYLLSVFPETKEFKIISHFLGETNICARLRKSGSTSSPELQCNNITINQASSQQTQSNSQNNSSNNSANDSSAQQNNSNYSTKTSSFSGDFIPLETTSQVAETKDTQVSDKIFLNQKKSDSNHEFVTSSEKIRLAVVYAFSAFAVVIIILLALRKL